MQKVTITRSSAITGSPVTRTVYIVRDCTTYTGIEVGRPVFIAYTPNGPKFLEVLSDAEQASIV